MTSQMHAVSYGTVDLLQWNPRVPLPLRPRRAFRWTRMLPIAQRVNNFGDLLGPVLVSHIAEQQAIQPPRQGQRRPLASIGSVMHMLPSGCTVWGSGVNGKSLSMPLPTALDVRAVRGPLTRDYLAEQGVSAPEIFGDPGLLAPMIFGDTALDPQHELTIIWNMNDGAGMPPHPDRVEPTEPLSRIVERIRRSRFVVGSSLHALVLADAFGIPSRPIVSEREPEFKYHDYYLGSGRKNIQFARNLEEALTLGPIDALSWSPADLLSVFPNDVFSSNRHQS